MKFDKKEPQEKYLLEKWNITFPEWKEFWCINKEDIINTFMSNKHNIKVILWRIFSCFNDTVQSEYVDYAMSCFAWNIDQESKYKLFQWRSFALTHNQECVWNLLEEAIAAYKIDFKKACNKNLQSWDRDLHDFFVKNADTIKNIDEFQKSVIWSKEALITFLSKEFKSNPAMWVDKEKIVAPGDSKYAAAREKHMIKENDTLLPDKQEFISICNKLLETEVKEDTDWNIYFPSWWMIPGIKLYNEIYGKMSSEMGLNNAYNNAGKSFHKGDLEIWYFEYKDFDDYTGIINVNKGLKEKTSLYVLSSKEVENKYLDVFPEHRSLGKKYTWLQYMCSQLYWERVLIDDNQLRLIMLKSSMAFREYDKLTSSKSTCEYFYPFIWWIKKAS